MKNFVTICLIGFFVVVVSGRIHAQEPQKADSGTGDKKSTQGGNLRDHPTETKKAIKDALKEANAPNTPDDVDVVYDKLGTGTFNQVTVWDTSAPGTIKKIVLIIRSLSVPAADQKDLKSTVGRAEADNTVAKNMKGKETTQADIVRKEGEAQGKYNEKLNEKGANGFASEKDAKAAGKAAGNAATSGK